MQLHTLEFIVATHNRAKLLLGLLDSIRRLRIPADWDVSLTVVTNACTDDSAVRIAATGSAVAAQLTQSQRARVVAAFSV